MAPAPATHASRQRHLLVFLLFLHTVNTYMDRICISVAKDAMQNDIEGLDDQMMGLAFGIFSVGYALFQIPSGWLSDRLGPRRALTVVVVIWSVFTALTGAVHTALVLLAVRFLFGVGEAGAYPGATRALYSWLPAQERGVGQGVFHSGARVGAALSIVIMPWVIDLIGWRLTFVVNAGLGFVWAIVWWYWFRDRPQDHPGTNEAEVEHIEAGLVEAEETAHAKIPFMQLVTSKNLLLAMFQYSASNITFFISLTWLRPYIVDRWGDEAAYLSAVPLLVGAVSLWVSGSTVTFLHRRGYPVMSRRLPAMLGYSIAATGLLLCTQSAAIQSVEMFVIAFSIAIFGVEMTLSPSWAFCMDIGGNRSGAVSASMNMVGNLGAALSAVLFPYFVANVTLPWIAPETGTANSFFVMAASMNVMAVVAWGFMDPKQKLEDNLSKSQLRIRAVIFYALIATVVAIAIFSLYYKVFVMGKG